MPVWKRSCRWLALLAMAFATFGQLAGGPAASNGSLNATDVAEGREAIRRGVELERNRNWAKAIGHYEESLKSWPGSNDLKYGLRRTKIHFGIERRYSDRSFEQRMLTLPQNEALALYDEILDQVRSNYVESLSLTAFVAHGTESLYLALANDQFLNQNLRQSNPTDIAKLRTVLREEFWNRPVSSRQEARDMVLEICRMAQQTAGLASGPVLMEYVFGGCNALDDYSTCLTPDRLKDLFGNIEGEFVGLGIEMKAEQGKGMLLLNVLPDSPAREAGMRRGEFIVSIDGVDCTRMTTDQGAKLLRGKSGTIVPLRILSPRTSQERSIQVPRRAVHVRSLPIVKIIDRENGVGYIQMTGFQKTSPREMDEALVNLQRQGMKSLIWDVRGNPGGLLTAAVEVLDHFIEQGTLVSTRGRSNDQNYSYSARPSTKVTVPLILLVDGDSASASEIVAGAIHDHKRGIIVGRQTYGKWSVQSILQVRNGMGLRLTTAKFYSPHGRTLGKVGVKPDVVVELPESHKTAYRGLDEESLDTDLDVRKALDLLRRQTAQR